LLVFSLGGKGVAVVAFSFPQAREVGAENFLPVQQRLGRFAIA